MLRRYVMRVRELEPAYDVLLPLLVRGVHLRGADELIALGSGDELPPAEQLTAALGDLLVAPLRVEEAGTDLAAALAALREAWVVDGRVAIRTADQPAPGTDVDVVLTQGAGFGTGAHPTTRHCLSLLLGLDAQGPFADLGCGAGALTIAAAKLGFSPVAGVELMQDAAASARANVVANDVDVDIICADLRELAPLTARVAVVNVSELPVHEAIARWEWPGIEALIVSGLQRPPELEQVLAWYSARGFAEQARYDASGWPAVLLSGSAAA